MAKLSLPEQRLHVPLGGRSYDIVIGEGLVARAGAFIPAVLHSRRAIIITDSNVSKHWQAPLEKALRDGGMSGQTVEIPAGEESKSFAVLEQLVNTILEFQPDRKTALIALGGGVVGDLSGFAASIVLRGLPFVQIPTTLLSQVDSSVGGKTGINTGHGKNLVGSFYQPRLVLADTATLATLPERERKSGYAEIAKYGLINRPEFFAWLETNGAAVLEGDAAALTRAVYESCKAKAEIVAADERESGERALLNLGHTFAHALEAELGYDGTMNHGEAVAIGLLMAFDLSVRLGFCTAEEAARVKAHHAALGLASSPLAFRKSWDADTLLAHMQQDKKTEEGKLTFILAKAIGKSFISRDVAKTAVRDILTAYTT